MWIKSAFIIVRDSYEVGTLLHRWPKLTRAITPACHLTSASFKTPATLSEPSGLATATTISPWLR